MNNLQANCRKDPLAIENELLKEQIRDLSTRLEEKEFYVLQKYRNLITDTKETYSFQISELERLLQEEKLNSKRLHEELQYMCIKEEEINHIRTQINDSEIFISEKDLTISNLKHELSQWESTEKSYKEQIKSVLKENTRLEEILRNSHCKIEALAAERSETHKDNLQLKRGLLEKEKEISDLKGNYYALKKEFTVVQEKNLELTRSQQKELLSRASAYRERTLKVLNSKSPTRNNSVSTPIKPTDSSCKQPDSCSIQKSDSSSFKQSDFSPFNQSDSSLMKRSISSLTEKSESSVSKQSKDLHIQEASPAEESCSSTIKQSGRSSPKENEP